MTYMPLTHSQLCRLARTEIWVMSGMIKYEFPLWGLFCCYKMRLPRENKQLPPLEQLPDGAKRPRSFKLMLAMVDKGLRSLNELKSVGPDGVSPRLLKQCPKEL